MMQFSARKRKGEVVENPATSLQNDEKVYVKPKPLAKAVDFSWIGQTEVKPEVLRLIIDAAHRKHEKYHLPEPIDPDAPIPGRISPTRREHEKVHECGQINVQIQDSIQLVEDKTKQNALEKERLLVRDFKDKLSIAEKTIEELKKRSPEFDANYWMKKYMEVQREVDVIQSEAIRLDSLNTEVADEMNTVRSELHSSQAECEGLTKRLVGAKKEIRHLSEEVGVEGSFTQRTVLDTINIPGKDDMKTQRQRGMNEVSQSFTPQNSVANSLTARQQQLKGIPVPKLNLKKGKGKEITKTPLTNAATTSTFRKSTDSAGNQTDKPNQKKQSLQQSSQQQDKDQSADESGVESGGERQELQESTQSSLQRLHKQNKRMRILLDSEKKSARTIRNAHLLSQDDKLKLQNFMGECIADVQMDIRNANGKDYDSEESRVRTMEVLQSRLSVLELLCEKTFPNITKLTIGIVSLSKLPENTIFNESYKKEADEMKEANDTQHANTNE